MTESPRDTSVRLVPVLRASADRYAGIRRTATDLAGGLSAAQLAWRPAPNRWSIGEIFEHLNLSGTLPLPEIDAAIARGRGDGMTGDGPFRRTLAARLFTWMLTLRVRLKAPPAFVPPVDYPPDVVGRFVRLQDDIAERIERANGLDLYRVRISSPASSRIRFDLGSWFPFTATHEERHLAQIGAVKDNPALPSA